MIHHLQQKKRQPLSVTGAITVPWGRLTLTMFDKSAAAKARSCQSANSRTNFNSMTPSFITLSYRIWLCWAAFISRAVPKSMSCPLSNPLRKTFSFRTTRGRGQNRQQAGFGESPGRFVTAILSLDNPSSLLAITFFLGSLSRFSLLLQMADIRASRTFIMLAKMTTMLSLPVAPKVKQTCQWFSSK